MNTPATFPSMPTATESSQLRVRRERLGMSIRQIAKATDTAPSTISKWEAGGVPDKYYSYTYGNYMNHLERLEREKDQRERDTLVEDLTIDLRCAIEQVQARPYSLENAWAVVVFENALPLVQMLSMAELQLPEE